MNISQTDDVRTERYLRYILLLALCLRLYGLTAFSLSNDELSALSRLRVSGFYELIQKGVIIDFHPAGTQLFLYYWTKVFGISEWVVRFPFAIMGVLSVWLIFQIGRLWFGNSTGLLAAASLAGLSFPLLYSQIARPYSPGLMASLSATMFWSMLIFGNHTKRNNLKSALGFVLSVSACMYTHYFSFIFAGLLCFTGLFFIKRETLIYYLLSGAGILILYTPHLHVFVEQISRGGIGGPDGWLGPPGDDAFGKYLDYCFNDSYLLKLIYFVAFSGLFLIYRGKIRFGRFHLLSILFFLMPWMIAYFYSIYQNPVYQHSILLFSFPFLLLFLFSFASKGKFGITSVVVSIIITAATFYSTAYEKKYYSISHFTEFRALSNSIENVISEKGKSKVGMAINVHDPYYLNYYISDSLKLDSSTITRIISREDLLRFHSTVANCAAPYFILAYSNINTPSAFDVFIRNYYPAVIRLDTFLNSGFRLYTRDQNVMPLNDPPDVEILNDFENRHWAIGSDMLDSVVYKGGHLSCRLRSSDEYSPGYSTVLRNVGLKSGSLVESLFWMYSEKMPEGVKLVCSIDYKGKSYYWNAFEAADCMIKKNNWFCVAGSWHLPEGIPEDAEMKIYIWNEGKKAFNIDDFKVMIYRSRPNTFIPPM